MTASTGRFGDRPISKYLEPCTIAFTIARIIWVLPDPGGPRRKTCWPEAMARRHASMASSRSMKWFFSWTRSVARDSATGCISVPPYEVEVSQCAPGRRQVSDDRADLAGQGARIGHGAVEHVEVQALDLEAPVDGLSDLAEHVLERPARRVTVRRR